MTGIMFPGEKKSKADWFKIKITKKRIINFSFEAYGNAGLKVYIYGPKIKKSGLYLNTYKNSGETCHIGITKGVSKTLYKLNAGTYYVKIVRAAAGNSAVYTLRWK